MSIHTFGGVGDETFVNCPDGLLYGPAPDAEDTFSYCPYCGDDTDTESHRVDGELSEVFCEKTITSTYRFCPNCGVNLKEEVN